jgi:TorA maturation chaperone TorD
MHEDISGSMTKGAELAVIFSMRGQIYAMARNLTGAPPSVGLLAGIADSPAIALLAEDMESVAKIFSGARECLLDTQYREETKNEYQRLFIGPRPIPAPLWESVFLDKDHLLFGEDTLNVRRFYATCGLEFSERYAYPDDHISVELEFMCRLNNSAIKIITKPSFDDSLTEFYSICSLQLNFLEHHILRWVPQSFSLQLLHVSTLIYEGLAELLATFPPYDAHLLAAVQGETPKCMYHMKNLCGSAGELF